MNTIFFRFKPANDQIVFKYPKSYGDPVNSLPLGLTIDVDGYLYVAIYYGGVVLKLDPQ